MDTRPDPYEWANGLLRVANDVAIDVTSLTISDITETLRNTAQVLVDLADDYHSLRTSYEVILEVNGERIDLTDYIRGDLFNAFVQSYIPQIIKEYVNAKSV
jgi:hypothetical protein